MNDVSTLKESPKELELLSLIIKEKIHSELSNEVNVFDFICLISLICCESRLLFSVKLCVSVVNAFIFAFAFPEFRTPNS